MIESFNNTTMIETLGLQLLKSKSNPNDGQGHAILTNCDCCHEYKDWKAQHFDEYKRLQRLADESLYYKAFPDKQVTIATPEEVHYKGTIHSARCTGKALTTGDHPFQCFECYSLMHGKSLPLLRLYNRSKMLKYSRSDPKRATKVGVNHKFCSTANLEDSLKHHQEKNKMQKEKCTRLSSKIEELLHKSWHDSETTIPFLQTLHSLIEDKRLNDFDLSFLQNWTHKKAKGKNLKADEQARFLAILYSNKLGKKNSSELAPILGLPGEHQVQRIKSKETNEEHFLPGINEWAIKKASERLRRPLQNGMDGTRVIRTVELY